MSHEYCARRYTSPDLVNWTFVSNVLPLENRPTGIYFRPKVVKNPASGKFILWVNFLPPAATPLAAYPNATIVVAESTTAFGPFTVRETHATVAHKGVGDIALLVDPTTGIG